MARQFFVSPESVKLPLFDEGEYWILVKRELNAGEAKQVARGAFKGFGPKGIDVDFEAAAFQKILVYLNDWNLTDKDGKTVAIGSWKEKHDAVRALSTETCAEIERVIDAHVLASQEKKQPSGSPALVITS